MREPAAAGDGASEGIWVLRASGAIVVLAYLAITLRTVPGGASERLLSYQVPFTSLAAADQLVIRQLVSALMEADYLRSSEGRWPTPERLAADGAPPFADAKPRHRWELRAAGGAVNILGTPLEAGRPTILVFLEEPPAGGDPTHDGSQPLDADHRRLGDGTVVHCTYWMKELPVEPGIVGSPAGASWRQIVL